MMLEKIFEYGLQLGVPGLIFIIWWYDQRQIAALLTQYRDDAASFRKMYENNVEIVKKAQKTSDELLELIYHVSVCLTRIEDKINSNREYFTEQCQRITK